MPKKSTPKTKPGFPQEYPHKLKKTSADRFSERAIFRSPIDEIPIDKALDAIERTDINFSQHDLDKFRKVIEVYYYNIERHINLPSRGDKKRLMHNISKSVENLIESIKRIQHFTIMRNFPLLDADKNPYNELEKRKEAEKLYKSLRPWQVAAMRFPITNKQPRKAYMKLLIKNLAMIYEEATGKKPKAWQDEWKGNLSPFLKLVDDIFFAMEMPLGEKKKNKKNLSDIEKEDYELFAQDRRIAKLIKIINTALKDE